MKLLKKISIVLALLLVAAVPVGIANVKANKAEAAGSLLLGSATGYTQASDVDYKKSGNTIINWGAREEDCTFLTAYAQSFYTSSYTYETLSQQSGGSSQSNASSSTLYKSLQTLMKSKHENQTSYNATREMYRYTDCVNGNSNKISSFYSGKGIGPTWDSGATWNREHTWPNSKGLGGNDENDIMMLRPTSTSENSSRGNDAYGQSGGDYYNPNSEGNGNVDLRGDCARICLYVYVRWGNTSNMWGSSGVMENLNVLLQWMEEDPVDTWEMGRNDSVQSITGTRNVFVDYPEYAWLLFGQTAPDDMPTPSGKASNGQLGGGNGGSSSSGDVSIPDDDSDSSSSGGEVDTPDYSNPEDILNALYDLSVGEILDGPFTLTGKITKLDSFSNPTIVVDGFEDMPVYCYKLKVTNKVGDIITVTADNMKNHEGIYEFMNCTLVSSESGGNSSDSSGNDSNDDVSNPDDDSDNSSGNVGDNDSSSDSGNVSNGDSLVKFDFGENKGASHVDGNGLGTSKTYTESDYTLNLMGMSNVYGPAYDAKGNSCIKVGSSNNIGSFSFTVDDNVAKVVIEVAKYKNNASTIVINGKSYELTKNSNDGQYDVITVDTTETKTVNITTDASGKRVMINSIELFAFEDAGDDEVCEHEFGDWEVIKEATVDEEGEKIRKCTKCDAPESEVIPKLDKEDSSLPDDSDSDSEDDTCEHEFSDWIVVKEATETKEGKQCRTCYKCGDTEEEIIPKLESGDASQPSNSTGEGNDTVTGDNSITAGDTDTDNSAPSDTDPVGEEGSGCGSFISMGASLISLAVLIGCGLMFKKNKQDE